MVALVDRLEVVLALDHDVGFCEPLVDVAKLVVGALGNVAYPVRLLVHVDRLEVVVEKRGVLFHALRCRQHGGHDLIFDLDQLHSLFGDVRTGGRHRRYGVALVQGFVAGEDVVAPVLEIPLAVAGRQVLGGD